MTCACRVDADALDAELDERIRELAGRSPTRIERKPGVVGDFAIARRPQ